MGVLGAKGTRRSRSAKTEARGVEHASSAGNDHRALKQVTGDERSHDLARARGYVGGRRALGEEFAATKGQKRKPTPDRAQ